MTQTTHRSVQEIGRNKRQRSVALVLAGGVALSAMVPGAQADWSSVEVTPAPRADIDSIHDTPVASPISRDWTVVASDSEKPNTKQFMQSTVGPSAVERTDIDRADSLSPIRRPASRPGSNAPTRGVAPNAPGLAASKLVPKPATGDAPAANAATSAGSVAKTPPQAEVKGNTPASPEQAAAPQASGVARQYCVNIADAASDARFAWKARTLAEIEQEIEERIATLERKTAEFQKWLARRDEFSNKAVKQLVGIYRRMPPDSAAAQLTAMDAETAAAVLSKLDARVSSAILNEMQPKQAARLTSIIAGSAKIPKDSPNPSARLEQAESDAGKI